MSYDNFDNTKNKIEKIYNTNQETKTKIDNFKIKSYDININELNYNQKIFEKVYDVDEYDELYREKVEINFHGISDLQKTNIKIIHILESKLGDINIEEVYSYFLPWISSWWEEDKFCFSFFDDDLFFGFVNYNNYQIRILIYYLK